MKVSQINKTYRILISVFMTDSNLCCELQELDLSVLSFKLFNFLG